MLRQLSLKNWVGLLILLICLAFYWTTANNGDINPVAALIFAMAGVVGGYLFIRGKN